MLRMMSQTSLIPGEATGSRGPEAIPCFIVTRKFTYPAVPHLGRRVPQKATVGSRLAEK